MHDVDRLPPNRWLIWLSLIAPMFIAALDAQIIYGALPEISRSTGIGRVELSLLQTPYLIAQGLMLICFNYLYQRCGSSYLVATNVAVFGFASVGIAMVRAPSEVIMLRIIQGFSSGALIPLPAVAASVLFSGEAGYRVRALGGVIVLTAWAIGPSVGGILAHCFGWRSIFLVNAPIALICVIASWKFSKLPKPADRAPIDWASIVALFGVSGGAILSVENIAKDSRLSILSCLVALAGVWVLVIRCRKYKYALISTDLLRQKLYVLGVAQCALISITSFGSMYIFPFAVAGLIGAAGAEVGVLTSLFGWGSIVAAAFLTTFTGYRREGALYMLFTFMYIGGVASHFIPVTAHHFSAFVAGQFVRGFCATAMGTLILNATFKDLPHKHLAQAASLWNFVRLSAGAMGIAGVEAVHRARADVSATLLMPGRPVLPYDASMAMLALVAAAGLLLLHSIRREIKKEEAMKNSAQCKA